MFGADCQAEFDFLTACFERYARRPVRRLLEPACGTGRLLAKFAKAGYDASGIDLNPNAVEYCNARLVRHGLAPTAAVGDMTDFRVKRKVDAAFSTINSFRHLESEEQAQGHLECVAQALAKGGIYMLGFHLTPRGESTCDEESWSARRGHLSVLSRMWSIEVDRRRRRERVGFVLDVHTPTRQFRLKDEFLFRTYNVAQFRKLLDSVPQFETVETYDFAYEIDLPMRVNDETEDVIYVLRKR